MGDRIVRELQTLKTGAADMLDKASIILTRRSRMQAQAMRQMPQRIRLQVRQPARQRPLPDATWSTLGVWKNGSGTVLSILALDPAEGIYAASGFRASGPQSDSLVGMAKLEGTVLTIIPTDDGHDPEDTKKSCKIVMRFSPDFKTATILSSECAMLQHPACEGQTIVLNKKQE